MYLHVYLHTVSDPTNDLEISPVQAYSIAAMHSAIVVSLCIDSSLRVVGPTTLLQWFMYDLQSLNC